MFKQFIVYKPLTNDYDMIVCKVNNIVFAYLMLMLVWIVTGERTVQSFCCFAAIGVMVWVEFASEKFKVSEKFIGLVSSVGGKYDKLLQMEKWLGGQGYITQPAAYKNESSCSDNLEAFDRRVT